MVPISAQREQPKGEIEADGGHEQRTDHEQRPDRDGEHRRASQGVAGGVKARPRESAAAGPRNGDVGTTVPAADGRAGLRRLRADFAAALAVYIDKWGHGVVTDGKGPRGPPSGAGSGCMTWKVFPVDKRTDLDAYTFRNLVIRPVATHSATKMFPSWSKQASCGWMNRPACQRSGWPRILNPSSTCFVHDGS